VPGEIARRGERIEKLRAATAVIAARAKARQREELATFEAQQRAREERQKGTGQKPRGRAPKPPQEGPRAKDQYNFTDPESRIMVRDGGFLQAYNAQIAVDDGAQIIVAAALSNQAPDVEYFEPLLRRTVDNCDAVPDSITADAGYFSAANVAAAEAMGTEPFIAVGGHHRNGLPEDGLARPDQQTLPRRQMRALLATDRGRAAYARRKATVEPVFGQIRACRGIRQLSFRGLFKNRCEWLLICATHNLLKLWRALRGRRTALAATAMQTAAAAAA